MAIRFNQELFEESLEEAGTLFVRRCQDLDPPELGLSQVRSLDDRLDAHLDLLFFGGKDAADFCRAVPLDGGGAVYAATRTLAHAGNMAALRATANEALALNVDPNRLAAREPSPAEALRTALAHEPWGGDLGEVQATLLAGGAAPEADALAYAAGYQRWDVGPALLAGLRQGVPTPATWLWALGQIGEAPARDALIEALGASEAPVARAAALALCRTEDPQLAHWLLAQALNQAWAPVVLAFLGGPRAASLLAKHIETGDAFATFAAGLLGDGALVPTLLRALNIEGLAPAAAQALHLISGIGPVEHVIEPPNADEASRERAPSDADPLWRLSQDEAPWTEALARARLVLAPATRYRMGKIASPEESLSALYSQHLRGQMRALLIDELFVRYGLGVHLRADQHAGRQLRVLEKLEGFLPHMATKPAPGTFSFQGRGGLG